MNAKGTVHKFGDNVDTDVIIPARYLNTASHKELAAHCMEDIDADFVNKVKEVSSPTKQQAKHIRLSRSPSSFRTSSKKAVSSTRLCNPLILIYNYNRTINGRLVNKSAVFFSL